MRESRGTKREKKREQDGERKREHREGTGKEMKRD